MPESVTDRPTKAHEYVFLLTKSPRYFFDQEAVREEAQWERWGDQTNEKYYAPDGWSREGKTTVEHSKRPRSTASWIPDATREELTARAARGRNLRSVWEIATQPYPDAHFATFPEALPERCIKAGSSERGCCPECGAPWERELENQRNGSDWNANNRAGGDRMKVGQSASDSMPSTYAPPKTLGWKMSCGCTVLGHEVPPVPCTVLDPFMGSGTTALVARRLGRRSIGVELNPEYAALCARRLQQLSLLTEASV